MPKNTTSKTKNTTSKTKNTTNKTKNTISNTKNTTSKTKKSQESIHLQIPSTNQSIDSSVSLELQSISSQTLFDFDAITTMLNDSAKKILEYNKMSQCDAKFNLWQILDQAKQAIQSERDKISTPYPLDEAKYVQFWYDLDSSVPLSSPLHNYIEDGYKKNEFNAEIRCFYVPADSVRKEYEILCQYKKDNIFELIQVLCTDLLSIITLLEYLKEHKYTSVGELYKICASISNPTLKIREICSQLVGSKLIHKRIA